MAPPDFAALVDRLLSLLLPDGGLPYYRGNSSSAEPTLLAALALFAVGRPRRRARSPFSPSFAVSRIRTGRSASMPCTATRGLWLTAPAAIAFHRFGLKDNLRSALDFILSAEVRDPPNDPRLKQDNTLTGWPWVRGTFGWVEPTAWSVIALVLSGLGGHPRAAEGRRLLLDREIPSGGWNYGNPARFTIRNSCPSGTRPGWPWSPSSVNSGPRPLTEPRPPREKPEQDRIPPRPRLGRSGPASHGRDTASARERKLRDGHGACPIRRSMRRISPSGLSRSPGRRFSSHEAARVPQGRLASCGRGARPGSRGKRSRRSLPGDAPGDARLRPRPLARDRRRHDRRRAPSQGEEGPSQAEFRRVASRTGRSTPISPSSPRRPRPASGSARPRSSWARPRAIAAIPGSRSSIPRSGPRSTRRSGASTSTTGRGAVPNKGRRTGLPVFYLARPVAEADVLVSHAQDEDPPLDGRHAGPEESFRRASRGSITAGPRTCSISGGSTIRSWTWPDRQGPLQHRGRRHRAWKATARSWGRPSRSARSS